MKLLQWFSVSFHVLQIRCGWWQYRRSQGHPITITRALFGKMPRFGSYEYDEEGCSEECKEVYRFISKD